ncbi:MAG: outer membrane protein assembly factor BamC [Gammaproteobacteria bacterium]
MLETDWQENRFDVPTNWLSRLFSKLYDTGLMDSYRIRLERSADEQHTLVFIAHRGLKEAFAEDHEGLAESKGWTVRAADPELENEMLLRFAINLGGDKAALERQRAEVSQQPEFARVALQEGVVVLQLNEGFARGWRRVGLALDRMGVLIEDRNRSQGAYFIRLSEELLKEDGGLLAKLFSGKTEVTRNEYLLRLIEKDNKTLVAVFDRQEQPVSSNVADRILNRVKAHLN